VVRGLEPPSHRLSATFALLFVVLPFLVVSKHLATGLDPPPPEVLVIDDVTIFDSTTLLSTGILGKRNQQRDRQISMRIYSKQQMKTQGAPQRCASWLVHVFSERPHFLLGTPLARRWPHQDPWTCRHPCSTLASDSVANVLPRFEEPQGYH
jgi:hypothetical protein